MPVEGQQVEMRGEERPKRRLLQRSQRRAQIISTAKRAFARTGFSATPLEEIAREAKISKAILYRHFDSKTDLYQAVLDDVSIGLQSALGGTERFQEASIDTLVQMARTDPDGFRLLFEHAAKEPEFREYADEVRICAVALTEKRMPEKLGESANVAWAARLIPALTIEAILTWLEAGQPNPDQAADIVRSILASVTAVLREGGPAD